MSVYYDAMYGYKGVVLVFGLFLAYEIRAVNGRQINDSRYVYMSIYNVVLLCFITAQVSLLIANQQHDAFAFVSLAIVFCCFLSMALILVFVAEMIEVIRHPTKRVETRRGSGPAPSQLTRRGACEGERGTV